MKQLTIDEKKWARGNINKPSRLLNNDGNMCCLGFLGKACKISKDILLDKEYPETLFIHGEDEYSKYPSLDALNIGWDDFVRVNDNRNISEDRRKEILTKMFKEHLGIKLIFK
jgi:hypothetical protein